jgi:hypothetical protein
LSPVCDRFSVDAFIANYVNSSFAARIDAAKAQHSRRAHAMSIGTGFSVRRTLKAPGGFSEGNPLFEHFSFASL